MTLMGARTSKTTCNSCQRMIPGLHNIKAAASFLPLKSQANAHTANLTLESRRKGSSGKHSSTLAKLVEYKVNTLRKIKSLLKIRPLVCERASDRTQIH